jgi:hypothetical protein
MLAASNGSLFSNEDDMIPVNLFDNLPFDTDHKTIAHWRAGDIMEVIKDEEKYIYRYPTATIQSVRALVGIHYNASTYMLECDALKLEYWVTYTVYANSRIMGNIVKIEDMAAKIREKKIDRLI